MSIDEVVSTTARAWTPCMAPDEYGALLNQLLEAERAGAKLLSAYLDELQPGSSMWESIRAVQLDEARNCAVLIHLLLEAEVTPTPAVGDFYGRGLAIRGWRERLEFLRGYFFLRHAACSAREASVGGYRPTTLRPPRIASAANSS